MKKQKQKKQFSYVLDLIPVLVAGPVLFLLFIILSGPVGMDMTVAAVIFFMVYALFALIYLIYTLKVRSSIEKTKHGKETFVSALEETLQKPRLPLVVIDSDGKTIWINTAARSLLAGGRELVGTFFDEYSPVTLHSLLSDGGAALELRIDDEYYEVKTYPVDNADKPMWFITFTDITETVMWRSRYISDLPCVAYVLIDNLAELTAQTGLGEYRDSVSLIDKILKQWADSINAVIREITDGRYIMVMNQMYLRKMCEDKFPILDTIKDAQKGSFSVPLTISMGISSRGETLAQKEHEALIALDQALQRGGAQVALVHDNEGYEFFGGRTKTSQKRTSIRSRIEAEKLITLIKNAGNVIIMGHANPDFDAIGATVGLARLAETYGREALIVTDKKCANFKIATKRLMKKDTEDYYVNLFAESERGLDAVRSDTLVILTDVNSIDRCECPQIALNAERIAVIDHHRKAGGNTDNPDLNYIDPSASSACEIVSEMLEHSPQRVELDPEEANVMMSGIMLDTQNFVKSVGARTFSAALHLRNSGANNDVANTFFYEDMEDHALITKLTSNIKLYRKKYIIAVNKIDNEGGARVAAAKAANKLLTLRGVEATFVLACVGDTVMVSARSNGKVNVQLILEKIGGGGHFDAAGAQARESSEATLTKLQRAIDDYENKTI